MTNFVLIHGANQGGWIWQPTAARLRAAGHLVYAPSLDGCAERRHSLRPGIKTATHATEIAELMFYEDLRDVVLAGTSAAPPRSSTASTSSSTPATTRCCPTRMR